MALFPLGSERELGEFGLSMGTDLAVAGSVGRHPDTPLTYRPIDPYTHVWFNLSTLVRNAYGAYTRDDQRVLDPQHLIDAVNEDIQALQEIYYQILPAEKPVEVQFYYNDYSKIAKRWPRALPRTAKTTLQQQTIAIHQAAINELLKQHEEQIQTFEFDLKGSHPKVALVTHYPSDLLSRKYFRELALLESHTGTLKTRETWHTKFTKGKELKRIPFDAAMLQIFGDGSTLLAIYPIKIRRKILEIAEKRRWTYMTTREKVIANVRSEKGVELVMLLNDLYR